MDSTKPRKRRIPPGDPRRAVGYLRVSTDRQELGPEAQRKSIEAWAAHEGVAVLAWHEDHVTGGEGLEGRHGLSSALLSLRPMRAGLLVVAKRDRLARDVAVAAAIEAAVAQSGAIVVSAAGEGGAGQDASSRFMRGFHDLIAEYEKHMIRQRTKSALAVKRSRGERAGTVPFGYCADGAGKLYPNETERGVVARVRALSLEGSSLRAIVKRLEAEGYASRTGAPFQLTQVAKMVRMSFGEESEGA